MIFLFVFMFTVGTLCMLGRTGLTSTGGGMIATGAIAIYQAVLECVKVQYLKCLQRLNRDNEGER